MKAVLFALVLVSLNAWSQTATEALQRVLPENEYEGFDPFNEKCTLDVIREPGQTMVKLWNSDQTTFMVVEGAPYRLDEARGFFASSIHIESGTNKIEITFSTERLNQFNRLIKFQRVFRNAQGQQWTSAQECTLDN